MEKPTKLFNKMFISICAVGFFANMGQFMMNTLIPKYADSFGESPVVIGLIYSVFVLTALFAKPVSGPAIDYYNKKYVLMVGIIAIMIAFLVCSIASNITMLIISRLIHGLGMGITPIVTLAMVSDAVGEEDLTKGVAYYGTVQALASAAGPAVGLELIRIFQYKVSFIIGAMVMFCALLITLTLKTGKNENTGKFKLTPKNMIAVEAIIPASIMIFLAANYVSLSSFLVLFAESISVEKIGLFFTVQAVTLVVCRPIVGKLSYRFGELKVLPFAIFFFAFAMVMISYSRTLTMFSVSAFISAFGYGACQPLIQSLCMKSVTPNRRGSASATCFYGTDIGYLIGPNISGRVAEGFGYAIMFRTMPVLLLISLIIFAVFRDRIIRVT